VSAAKRAKNPVLMLDFGDVSENSVAFAPDSARIRRAEVAVAIDAADIVIVAPSNPIVSIGPILAVRGVGDLLAAARRGGTPVLAVSPIVGGKALKGPADRMLASLGHEVLCIDLDPQANLTVGLGIDLNTVERSIADVLIDSNVTFGSIIRPTKTKKVDVAPATLELSAAEVELFNAIGREMALRDKLARDVIDRYDYVLIDCPPTLGLLTLNALVASDAVLIPLPCEYAATLRYWLIVVPTSWSAGTLPVGHCLRYRQSRSAPYTVSIMQSWRLVRPGRIVPRVTGHEIGPPAPAVAGGVGVGGGCTGVVVARGEPERRGAERWIAE